MEPNYQVTTVTSPKLYLHLVAAQQALFQKSAAKVVYPVIGILCLLITIPLHTGSLVTDWVIRLVIIALGLAVVRPVLRSSQRSLRRKIALASAKNNGVDKDILCTFEEDVFRMEDQRGRGEFHYGKLEALGETTEFFFLFLNRASACAVEKSSLAQPREFARWVEAKSGKSFLFCTL